jgi:hypothetical protein
METVRVLASATLDAVIGGAATTTVHDGGKGKKCIDTAAGSCDVLRMHALTCVCNTKNGACGAEQCNVRAGSPAGGPVV